MDMTTTSSERHVHVSGSALRVVDHGSGPPVLYLHGVGDTGALPPLIASLGTHRRVIRPDHPGFLHSEGTGTRTVRDVAEAHARLLEVLGVEEVDVIGCSLGGWIAAELALLAPGAVRSLLLIAPVGMPGDASAPDVYSLAGAALREATVGDPIKRASMAPPSAEVLPLLARNMAELRRLAPPPVNDPSLRERLRTVDRPCVVAWGTADGILPPSYADDWIEALPHARLALVAGAGHLPHLEDPVGFRDATNLAPAGEETPWS